MAIKGDDDMAGIISILLSFVRFLLVIEEDDGIDDVGIESIFNAIIICNLYNIARFSINPKGYQR